MNCLISIASLLGIDAFFQRFFKKQFAEAVPVAACTVALLLYSLTYFLPLKTASVIVCCLGAAGFIYALTVEAIEVKSVGFNAKKYISIPFILFILTCVLFYLALKDFVAKEWDEFSLWMSWPKNIYFFNDFGRGEYSTMHSSGSYSPIKEVFNVFFTIFEPKFKEGNIYFGQSVLLISLIFAPLKNTAKNFWTTILVYAASLFMPLMFFNAYTSLYADCLLGMFFAYYIYSFFTAKECDIFSAIVLIVGGSMLIMAKPISPAMYLIALAIFASYLIFIKRKEVKELISKKTVSFWIPAVLVVLIPVLYKISWLEYNAKGRNITSALDTESRITDGLYNVFVDGLSDNRKDVISNFISCYFSMRDNFSIKIRFSYFLLPVILFFLMIYIGKISSERKKCTFIGISNIAVHILYSVALLLSYVFIFSEYEASILHSVDRYMSTINLSLVTFVFWISLNVSNVLTSDGKASERKTNKFALVSAITSALVLYCTVESAVNFFALSKREAASRVAFREKYSDLETLAEKMDYKTDKVYFISQGSDGFDIWIAGHTATPVNIANGYATWWLKGNSMYSRDYSVEEWSDILKDQSYTYVYVYRSDDTFKFEYSEMFYNNYIVDNDQLYSVEILDDGKVKLRATFDVSVTSVLGFDVDSRVDKEFLNGDFFPLVEFVTEELSSYDIRDYIAECYVKLLGREGSEAEIDGYEAQTEKGIRRIDIAYSFITSEEFRSRLYTLDYKSSSKEP